MSEWQLLSKETIFEAPYGRSVENWRMRTHRGEERNFIIQAGKEIIILLAVTADNEVVVAHEFFPADQKKLVSLVAGIVDEGEAHRKTVEKELLEEAGYAAEEFMYLGALSRGKYISGSMHAYLATGAKKVSEQNLEPSEDIDIELVPIDTFRQMLKNGKIGCVFEVACAYMALDYLNRLTD